MKKIFRNYRDLFTLFVVFGIVFFGTYGYHLARMDQPGPNGAPPENLHFREMFLWLDALYKALAMFVLAGIEGDSFTNWPSLLASFGAALFIGIGAILYFSEQLNDRLKVLRITAFWKNHFIVAGSGEIARQAALELLEHKQRVVVLTAKDNGGSENEELKAAGALLIYHRHLPEADLASCGIKKAGFCLFLYPDDARNLEMVSATGQLQRQGKLRHKLKVITGLQDRHHMQFLQDHMDVFPSDSLLEIRSFNLHQEAARNLYNRFRPLQHISYKTSQQKGETSVEASPASIAIIGFDDTALFFLMENIVLSHSPGLRNLQITIICENADKAEEKVRRVFPFASEFVDLWFVEQQDEQFYHSCFHNAEFVEKAGQLGYVYLFGNDDSRLVTIARSFRQLLYLHTGKLNTPPLIITLPESSSAVDLLESSSSSFADSMREDLGIYFYRLLKDSIQKEKMVDEAGKIESMAKAVNYFYAMLYEFGEVLEQELTQQPGKETLQKAASAFLDATFGTASPLGELEEQVLAPVAADTGISAARLKHKLGVETFWVNLTDLKKDSNRYVARHLPVKTGFLQEMGIKLQHSKEIEPYFKVLAPVEHKRWCGEKMALAFQYGPLPADRKQKKLLKDQLKIHDQLIAYEKLSKEMEDKDFNMFLLIPVLQRLQQQLA